jgi:hypothetical protein
LYEIRILVLRSDGGNLMKHLRVYFTDGKCENLESRWSEVEVYQGTLQTFAARVGGYRERGPVFVLMNIQKYEWAEGHQ